MKRLFLCFVFACGAVFLSADKVMEFQDVINPKGIIVHQNNLIIIQDNNVPVHVYSLDTFKLKGKLSKRGDGPGEVRRTPLVFPRGDSFVLFNRGKLLWFGVNGRLSGEKKVDHVYVSVKPVGDHFVASKDIFDPKDFSHTMTFFVLDQDLRPMKEIYQGNRDVNTAKGMRFDEFRMVTHSLEAKTCGDHIIVGDSRRGFFFKIFDRNGNHLYTIQKESENIRINDGYKKKLMNEFKAYESELWPMVKNVTTFYRYFPPFRSFFLNDERIYVTTYKQNGGQRELIVLDLKGNVLNRLFIDSRSWQIRKFYGMRVDLFTVKNNKLYELIDDEENESYDLHVTDFNELK